MPMMSDRASSFPPVKMSCMHVAQRTLELFTHVRSTGEDRREGGWTPEAMPLTVGHRHVQPERQEDGIPCSSSQTARNSILRPTSLALAAVLSLSPPTQGREQRPSLAPRWALTQAGHGEHAGSRGRGDAIGEHGLQYVVGEGHGDDGQAGRVHDEDGTPEQQEAGTRKGSSGTGIPLPSRPRCAEWGCTLGPRIQRRVPVPEAGFGPGRQGQTCRGLDSIVDSFDRDSVQHS